MNVAMMLRYYWYGTFEPIKNETVIDMDRVNRAWLDSGGNHESFKPIQYQIKSQWKLGNKTDDGSQDKI